MASWADFAAPDPSNRDRSASNLRRWSQRAGYAPAMRILVTHAYLRTPRCTTLVDALSKLALLPMLLILLIILVLYVLFFFLAAFPLLLDQLIYPHYVCNVLPSLLPDP